MGKFGEYFFEQALIAIVMVLTIVGSWHVFFAADASPQPHHYLHLAVNLAWLSLLLCQISLAGNRSYATHRNVGLSILAVAPLLVATSAMLAVHSAHKGLVSGEGDFLIVQNVMMVPELASIILLAFILRKRRKVHGAFLMSTVVLFLGISLFFVFRPFDPANATAAKILPFVVPTIGILFFLKDYRNGWPWLLTGSLFTLNDLIGAFLGKHDLIDPLTQTVGSMSKPVAFIVAFAVVAVLLAATGILAAKHSIKPAPVRGAA